MNGKPSGQVALITGSSRGLGKYLSLELAKRGVETILLARTIGGLEELYDDIKEIGAKSTIVPLDLNDNDAIDNLGFELNKKWGKLDILISSRYLKESKISNWSLSRRIFSLMANFLAKLLLNLGVSDYTNGFRIYSRKSVELITKKCGNIGDGFIVLSEILLIIKIFNLKISEVPSIFVNRKRGESSVNFKLIIQSFLGLIKLYFIKKNLNKKL